MKKIWATVRQSLSGANIDFTEGEIKKTVFLLAIPMILELSLESIFAVVDIFFVSKLGQNAIATVGLTESVMTLVYSLAIGLSTGAAAIIARRVGEKNHAGASHAAAQSLFVAFILILVLSITGTASAGAILQFMGASKEVIEEGTIFTQIMFGGSVSIVLLFLMNGIFRGAGNATMAMKSLWIASATNIILCPILIHFLGLKGAAIATVIGRSSGVIYQAYHLAKGTGKLKLLKRDFRADKKIIGSIINIAWPATFQFIIGSGSWILLTRLVAETGGTSASAGYQIAFRNFMFFMLPAWGLSNAAATLVGQNLGAKHPKRAEESVMIAAKYNTIFMACVTALFIFFANPIISFFSEDKTIIHFGSQALQIIGAGYIFYGIAMVMTQALNGAGDTRTPTLINFFSFWMFQIPLAYLLALGINMGTTGVFLAAPTAEIVIALMAFYFFKKGKWKEVNV